MLAAGPRLGLAPGGGRPLGCPAVARSRRLGICLPAQRSMKPIAAMSADSEEWERRRDGNWPAGQQQHGRRRSGEGPPTRSRQVGQPSGAADRQGSQHSSSSSSKSRNSSRQRSATTGRAQQQQQQWQQQGQRPWEDHRPVMAALGRCGSCADVLQLVLEEDAKAGSWRVHKHVLSGGLDSMKKKAAREGGSEADRRTVAQLLRLATQRLGEFEPRQLVAYIRCAAAFKSVLQPRQLEAWQAAALHQQLQRASAQDVSNMLLSLGTLAESDEQLAAVVSQPLTERLLEHAAELAVAGKLGPLQHVANCLYGTALLGLQPTAAQAAALFCAVQRALEQEQQRDDHIAITQVLLACAKLSDVQTEPGATPTPGEDPFLRFYPGAGLVDALLRRATSVPLGSQSASQLVGACGALLHMPGQQEGTALLAALRKRAGNMNAIEASALLMGCARLGAPPGPAAIEACVAAVERERSSSGRAASNIAWALAVLEACDLHTWGRLTAVAASNVASLLDVQFQQWAQAHQLMQVRHGQAALCPSELLQHSQAAWAADLQQRQQQHQAIAGSRFERLLAAAVAEVADGHAVQPAHIATSSNGEPLALVDVALPQLRIALEADGPRHFLRNRQGSGGEPLPDGPTRARDRLLEGHGWRVVAVASHEWNRLMAAGASTDAKLQAGLRRYLEERSGLAAAIVSQAVVGCDGT